VSDVVTFTDGAHWYERDGTPAYTRLTKDGRERNTTLRDARKENLFPSVTTILGILRAPFLERWKLENLLVASLTLPRMDGEDEQSYAHRVWEDAQSVGQKATGFGSRYHDLAELRLRLGSLDRVTVDEDLADYAPHLNRWCEENIEEVGDQEFTVVGDPGFAGRVDAYVKHKVHGWVYMDWKTQNVKGGKPNFYGKWVQQLAAYRHADKRDGGILSVVIDSNEPAPLVEKLWSEDECDHALETFLATTHLWQLINKYKPELT
jgi:hypothetical protein